MTVVDDPRWTCVCERRADATFVYAVRTTGIYCRSGCASRRPRPHNVEFFASSIDAERSGYRACKRCHPRSAASPDAVLVERLCRAIERDAEPGALERLLENEGVPPATARRLFRTALGVSPSAYAQAVRGKRLRMLLQRSPVTDAMYRAGYGSPASFYEQANAQLGMRPSTYRRGGAGERIRFAAGRCTLGEFVVAATDRGVCAVSLGEDADDLVRELECKFERATLVGGDVEFEQLVARVVTCLDDPSIAVDFPLDIRGTAFQRRVWTALADIPSGSTVSYAELARSLGAPRSARAVASACASNRLAVLVPCHRVVRRDGGVGGYRWGVERKARLLAREGARSG